MLSAWLDTGKPLGVASASPETRWFGSALHVDGGSTEVRPDGYFVRFNLGSE